MIIILIAIAVYMVFLLTRDPVYLFSFVLLAYCCVLITLLGAALEAGI